MRPMPEYIYLCHQCGHIFRLPAGGTGAPGKGVECPGCESAQIRELPSWVPMGSDLSEGKSQWQYECQQCKNKFELPVPGSPSQEKNIKCPACNGGHIHRLTPSGYEPLYCG